MSANGQLIPMKLPERVPLEKPGQAQDIANGLLFLAPDVLSYTTGVELVIDGGMTRGATPRWSLD